MHKAAALPVLMAGENSLGRYVLPFIANTEDLNIPMRTAALCLVDDAVEFASPAVRFFYYSAAPAAKSLFSLGVSVLHRSHGVPPPPLPYFCRPMPSSPIPCPTLSAPWSTLLPSSATLPATALALPHSSHLTL